MIRKLQRRLTLLYTLTTGIILTIVVIAISVISQLNLMGKIDENFQNYIMSISTKLQTDVYFNISWIATMEADNGLLIHIEENGKPLLYRGAWNPSSDRDYLIHQAKEQAKNLNTDISVRPVSSASISPVFTLKGTKRDQYKAIAVSYPVLTGYKSMILLYDISSTLKTLRVQRYLFIAADVAGIAAASHELRSPLMVIQSSAQAIDTMPEKTTQFTQNITKECTRMSHLINDMLTLASCDAENWSFTFETVDPNTLLIELYELYEPLCLEKKTPFHLDLPDDMLPSIKGDGEPCLRL